MVIVVALVVARFVDFRCCCCCIGAAVVLFVVVVFCNRHLDPVKDRDPEVVSPSPSFIVHITYVFKKIPRRR